jgi:hypothetical protein
MRRLTTLERAFELARSGELADVSAIKSRLRQEGYPDVYGQLYGETVKSQLRVILRAHRASKANGAEEE